ncbi:hypothetical protein RND81_06G140800 [Saponaria officinalis]|uniref:F-box domain-containing protein n=1 Tax=Saponaria officinalis TaxID=3572 RepID=A0AAW1K5T6_SAPOF
MAELMDLPVDLMINILLRFPAKTLLQFKCVCKLWCQIISSPHFTQIHLDQTLAQSNPIRRFVFSAPHLSSAEFDTFDRVSNLENPFGVGGFAHVVGCCHGLLCLCNYDVHLTILLYNPTTRTQKILPFLPKPSSLPHRYCFGFGYDTVSKDYKFVRILQSDEGTSPFRSQVMVYSLKTDSWVRGPNVPQPFFSDRDNGVLVGGSLHWAHGIYKGIEKHYSIISFSLSDHSFGEVPQPEYGEEFINLRVGVLDECFCLLVNDLDYSDIWVMKQYGVASSWTKLFRIGHFQKHMFFEWPIGYSLNRRELLLQQNIWRVVSFDLETQTFKDIKVCDFSRCIDTQVCVENLLMLKDAGSETQDTDPQLVKKRRRWKRLAHKTSNNWVSI